jgi:hypothetical protein
MLPGRDRSERVGTVGAPQPTFKRPRPAALHALLVPPVELRDRTEVGEGDQLRPPSAAERSGRDRVVLVDHAAQQVATADLRGRRGLELTRRLSGGGRERQ